MNRTLLLVPALSFALAAPAALAQTNGPVGHWALNDADGSKAAADSSGHNNPAKCGPAMSLGSGLSQTVNCPDFGAAGKNGKAAAFEGIGNFLVVQNTVPKSLTVAAWMKTTDAGNGAPGDPAYAGSGVIWSDISGAAADMIPMSLLGGHIAFGTGDCKGGNYDTLVSTAAVNTGKWVFVAVTRDASTETKQLYIDGKLNAHHENTGTCALDANKIVAFGGNPVDDRYYKGALDEISFYDRALSGDEIVALMNPNAPPAKMAAQESPKPAAAPATAAGSDPFAGTWQADMSTVPAQQPPVKSQSFAFTKTTGGYTTEQTMVQQTKGGGTTTIRMGGKIVLGGKPFKGGMGEDRSCNAQDANTIHCTASMGPHSFEEIYTLSDGGKTFTDTMKGKDERGNVQSMSTVYRGHVASAAAAVAPSGSQRVVTHDGGCQVTVPADWSVDDHTRTADAPDMASEARISDMTYAENLKSLADLKPLVANAYKPVKSFEDTQGRLWYQYAPRPGKDGGWYVAVPGKGRTCNLELSFRNAITTDEKSAKAIALSLKPSP